MPTLQEALQHLGYDQVDEVITANVARELRTAESYAKSAVGADLFDLLPDDPKVGELVLAYLDDLHDDRGTVSAKAGGAKREMVLSMEWQLRLELVRAREEAAKGAGV